jgi:A1 cistron-splicing factor AAR2
MDEEDAPIIVSTQDIEASLARSSAYANNNNQVPMEIRQTYPLLVAAMMPQEDILMACARALDDAADVSLVREAAAYLEQVEQRNDAVQVHSQNERA